MYLSSLSDVRNLILALTAVIDENRRRRPPKRPRPLISHPPKHGGMSEPVVAQRHYEEEFV